MVDTTETTTEEVAENATTETNDTTAKDSHVITLNSGVLTLVDSIHEDIKALIAEFPFFDDIPVNYESVKKRFDDVMDKMANLIEKTNMTHVLVQSVINSIHSSRKELKDSVDGLLKKTGDQLGKITATTEAATNKILDEAMKLDGDQNTILDKLNELKSLTDTEEINAKIQELSGMIIDNQDSVFNIIQHLQFQDITAQQIKGAYSLLSDTEKTLLYVSNLLKEFDQGGEGIEITLPDLDKNAFNADAVFANKSNIQNAIDDLFNTGDTNVDIPEDEKVGGKAPADTGGGASGGDDDFDIDALFGGGGDKATNEKADQDDIDKLFS